MNSYLDRKGRYFEKLKLNEEFDLLSRILVKVEDDLQMEEGLKNGKIKERYIIILKGYGKQTIPNSRSGGVKSRRF